MLHNKKFLLSSCVFAFVFLGVIGFGLYTINKKQNSQYVTAGDSANTKESYRRIMYDGKEYQYNNLITTVLYAGIDSIGEIRENEAYASAARADSIALVVLDKKDRKMTIIGMNRDTMTSIRRYTISGYERGTYESHLGYAYTYGDGGEISCENLCEAVSELLGGIPVKNYVITNQTSMPYINELVGGITLDVPNDDVAKLHPELTEGAVVLLDERNVSDYLQYRDTSVSYSNEGRIERQKVYITEYIEKLKLEIERDSQGIMNDLDKLKPYLQTNITKNHYIDFINLFKAVQFEESNFYQIEGENREGQSHDEFYVDKEALMQRIIELFYEEV